MERTETEIKDKNGKIIRKVNMNSSNLLDGPQYFYRNEKLIMKENYEDGELIKSESYNENGNYIKSENFKNDVRNGFQFYYYNNGKIREKSRYIEGEFVSTEQYYENGNLKLIDDEKGFKEYYENGNLKKIIEMKDGKLHGIMADFKEKNNYPIYETISYFQNNELVSMKKNITFNIQGEFKEEEHEQFILYGEQEKINEFEKKIKRKNNKLLKNQNKEDELRR